MTSDNAIRTAAVAGVGIVGLSAAIALARALPGTRVTAIEVEPDPAALADVMPTTCPGVERFHAAIGLEESELVRNGIATHHLGTIFEDWSATGAQWVHAFGDYGKPAGAIPFDQIWCRAHEAGETLAYDTYSLGAALAEAGKFIHPASDRKSIGSRFRYGLRLDPPAYRDRLRSVALASGIMIIGHGIADVEAAGGRIEGLRLSDGSRIEADLFIDCSGPRGRLISAVDDSFEDWSEWMPFDRLQLRSVAGSEVPLTADCARANDRGWTVDVPLRGRVLRAELAIGGDGAAIRRGRRLRPWVANVLALGDAAIALDPLHGMNLHVAQLMILLALELLPKRDFRAVETEEHNRRAEQLTRRVRDWLALHYLRSGRNTGVWATLSPVEPPDSLAGTLDQYRYRGRLPFFEDEIITRESWTAALLGMGVMPVHADPQACGVPLGAAVAAMRNLATEIREAVGHVPHYPEVLARMAG